MPIWLVWWSVGASAIYVAVLLYLVVERRRHNVERKDEDAVSSRALDLCLYAKRLLLANRTNGVRYEVTVSDWGAAHKPAEMRWRWLVQDADRLLRLAAYPEEECDPECRKGVEWPYALGNAPDREAAVADAMVWVGKVSPGHIYTPAVREVEKGRS